MTKRNKKTGKICRGLMENLWGRPNNPINRKNYPPGQHGPTARRKLTAYGIQFKEMKKMQRYYGMQEKQYRRTFYEAKRRKGDTGENLVGLLESRLQSFIYRAVFVPTIEGARQLISHGHVFVNGQRVNVPSYMVKEGDVITLSEKAKTIPMIMECIQNPERTPPEYIETDYSKLEAKFIRMPVLSDVPFPFQADPSYTIEYYSK